VRLLHTCGPRGSRTQDGEDVGSVWVSCSGHYWYSEWEEVPGGAVALGEMI
jgi:hypothetical protein